MNRMRFLLLLLTAALLPATPLRAQQASPTSAATAGPRLERTVAGMRVVDMDAPARAMQARTNSMGKPVALMVVGGAAIILGSVIGDDIGTIFSIGGAIALLYGLYLYLR